MLNVVKKYDYKGRVTYALLHDEMVRYSRHRRKPDTECEEKLFAMFYEIANIARLNITSGGFRNLNDYDWQDIKMCAIEHMFACIARYNHRMRRKCYNFCYTTMSNKMKDIVRIWSFKHYVYNAQGQAMDFEPLNMSCDRLGKRTVKLDTALIRPLKRFNIDKEMVA